MYTRTYAPTYAQKRRRRWPYFLVITLLLLGGYAYWALTKPLPQLRPEFAAESLTVPPIGSGLKWPLSGQSAVGIVGTDILETHGKQKPTPTASTAKVITSLVILRAKPLQKGQQGPTVTLTSADEDLYRKYAAEDGSLVPVKTGEKITEYQMLEAIMLPSANNMADTMAIWAYGSLKNYAAAANNYLKQNGLNDTHVGSDASGMSPTTVSTAGDLVKLGKLAMSNPVLAEIAGKSKATDIPLAPNTRNVNFLLGESNIIGVKTGNTDQAGGVFISASRIKLNDKPVIIITANAKSPTLFASLKYSHDLVKSSQANFAPVTIVKAGQVVGHYQIPWGDTVDAIAAQGLTTTDWKGSATSAKVDVHPIAHDTQIAGQVILPASGVNHQKSVAIRLKEPVSKPSVIWRLTNPLR